MLAGHADLAAGAGANQAPGDANRQSRLALAVIIGSCLMVCVFLLVETATDWEDWPFHVATAVAQAIICLVALWYLREQGAHAGIFRAEMEDLRKAKATAESVNLAKSRYLTNISHEIRSPLNAIYGYAQLMERGNGVDTLEAAGVIRRCAEHMSTLIEGLLDISQVEHGVLRINTTVVRLRPFISQLLGMVRQSADAKGLTLSFTSAGRLPEFVRMDHGRLRQVLLNLLTNAIKFTDHGSVTLHLRYTGQTAIFEVRDTGPGIPPEDRDTIFDPFDRGGGEHAKSRPGAGLGLSISRAITGILGGVLDLFETGASGSIFRVTLMLGEVAGMPMDDRLERNIVGYEGPRRRVLVVDDDKSQRDFVTCLLRNLDFVVLEAAAGPVALDLAGKLDVDLVILDISMPGMSGWEVARQLRARHGRRVQILMLSASSGEMHGPEYRSQTHDYFLIKPVGFPELTEAIGDLLGLSWIATMAEAGEQAKDLLAPEAGLSEALGPSAAAHANHLRELLKIGYVRGMEEEIEQIKADNPELAQALFQCLDRLDLAAMSRILKGIDR